MVSLLSRDRSQNSRRKRIIGAILALLLALILFLLWSLLGREEDPAGRLLQLLEDARAELEAPGRTITKAAKTLGDADATYSFIMQDIALVPYLDRRQTPEQVLTTRMANPLDRAVLFGTLLEEMGWEIRYLQLTPLPDASLAVGRSPNENSPALTALRRFLDKEVTLPPDMQAQAEAAARSSAGDELRAEIAATVEQTLELLETDENSPGLNYPNYNDYNTIEGYGLLKRYVVVAERDGRRRVFDLLHDGNDPTLEEGLAGLKDTAMDQIRWDFYSYSFDMPKIVPITLRLGVVDSSGLEQTLIEWSGNPAVEELELRFLPAIDPLGKLRDGTQPEQVDQWQPYLRVNGRQITGKPFSLAFGGATSTVGLRPPITASDELTPANPTSATALDITQIDSADWPLVRVGLSVKASGGGLWLPDHFLLRDQGRAYPLRLLSVGQSARPLLILTDVSWSMGDTDAFESSKRAILSLLDLISEGQPVGLTSFALEPSELVPLAPLSERDNFVAGVEAMVLDSYTGILRALDRTSRNEALTSGVVLLLSDGEDNVGGDEAAIIDRLKQAGIKIYAIPLGEEADAALLTRLAEKTGGQVAYQGDAKGLEALFRRIGAEISSQVQLQYRVQSGIDENVDTDAQPALDGNISGAMETPIAAETGNSESSTLRSGERQITVVLRDTTLAAEGSYIPPTRTRSPAVPHLYLEVITQASGYDAVHNRARRVLLRLDQADTALRLTGTWSLIGDLGAYPERAYLIRYFSRWIDALRLLGVRTPTEIKTAPEAPPPQPMDQWLNDEARRWPSLARMRLVNSYRAFATIDTERGLVSPAPGPILYLHRAELTQDLGARQQMMRREAFDVLLRPARPLNSGEWNRDTMAGEIAAAIAEGRLLGGTDAISALLDAGSTLQFIPLSEAISGEDYPPGFLSAITPGWEGSTLVRIPGVRQWLWQIDTSYDLLLRNRFRTFYLDRDNFAKGASLEQIAQQFNKIDKLLALYGTAYGNFAGLTPFASAELGAIVAFKQSENKLWCYSTLMLAQVGETIESEEALLNRNVNAAREKAARLCKIEGGAGGAENGDLLRDGARKAVKEWARNYGINKTKEAIGDPISTGWSLWETGGALWDAVRSFQNEGFASSNISATGNAPVGGSGFPISPAQELAIAHIVAEVE